MINISKKVTKDVYSDKEVKTNKVWFNKPVYRKVYDFGTLPNNTSKNIDLNIDNLDIIINLYGITKNSSQDYTTSLPLIDASTLNNQVQVYVQNGLLTAYTKGNRSTYIGYIVLEYTKTND